MPRLQTRGAQQSAPPWRQNGPETASSCAGSSPGTSHGTNPAAEHRGGPPTDRGCAPDGPASFFWARFERGGMVKIRAGAVGRKDGGPGPRRVVDRPAGWWWGAGSRGVPVGGVVVTSTPTSWAPTSRYVKEPHDGRPRARRAPSRGVGPGPRVVPGPYHHWGRRKRYLASLYISSPSSYLGTSLARPFSSDFVNLGWRAPTRRLPVLDQLMGGSRVRYLK